MEYIEESNLTGMLGLSEQNFYMGSRESDSALFRAYFWLCTQGLVLVGLWGTIYFARA